MTEIYDRRKTLFLAALFAIAFIIRLIYLSEFHINNPLFDVIPEAFDHYNFDKGAINFSKGDLLATAPNNSFSPLYKYFLGIIYLLFGRNFYIVYTIQFAMGAISSVLLFLIAKDLFSFRAGIIAFLAFAFYSPQILYEGIILRAAFISFLGVLSFYLLYRLKDFRNTGSLLIATLILSLFIQARPNAIICLPFVCIYLYKIFSSIEQGEKIKNRIVFGATLLLSFIPLLIQCYIVWGKFVFFDASGPKAFISGNLVTYLGYGYDKTIEEAYLSEIKRNNLSIINFFFHYIFDNFTEFIKLYFRKIYFFLNDFEIPSNISVYLYRDLSTTLTLLWGRFALFSSLGIPGMFLAAKNKKGNFLLYSYIFSLSFSVIIFYNSSRFRMPVVPYFIIFSSYTIDLIITMVSEKKRVRATVIVLTVIALFIAFLEPKGMARVRTIDYSNIGVSWIKKGDMGKGIYYLDQAIKVNPSYSYNYYNKGQYYLIQKDFDKAMANFKKALLLSEKNTESKVRILDGISNAGYKYLGKNKYKRAIEIYSLILKYDPLNTEALLNMGVSYARLGNRNKAKKLFESILKIHPNHKGAKLNLSILGTVAK